MDSTFNIQNNILIQKMKSLEKKESELLYFKRIVVRDLEQFETNISYKRSIIYDMISYTTNVKSGIDYCNSINDILSDANVSKCYSCFNNILSEIECELRITREKINSLCNENLLSHI